MRMQARYIRYSVFVCIDCLLYSCSRINEVQVRVSIQACILIRNNDSYNDYFLIPRRFDFSIIWMVLKMIHNIPCSILTLTIGFLFNWILGRFKNILTLSATIRILSACIEYLRIKYLTVYIIIADGLHVSLLERLYDYVAYDSGVGILLYTCTKIHVRNRNLTQ